MPCIETRVLSPKRSPRGSQPSPHLSGREEEEAERGTTLALEVVHEAVRREGEAELERSLSALAWSAVAAGLSMGFSLAAEGVLRSRLPEADWAPLVSKLGYSVGFVIVILGRQQLFTENTLTAMIPVLDERSGKGWMDVLRLWAVVLAGNLAGALGFGVVAANTRAFSEGARDAFAKLAAESLSSGFGLTLFRGIFAGWLIALMVWLLPGARNARLPVIVVLTYLVGVCGFPHVIAGSIEVFAFAASGGAPWGRVLGGYVLPTLIGNTLGGVTLVAALNHAQVAADRKA